MPEPAPLGFTPIRLPPESVDLEAVVADIGQVAQGLYVLHHHLHHEGQRAGADLAALLEARLSRRHAMLRWLIEADAPGAGAPPPPAEGGPAS